MKDDKAAEEIKDLSAGFKILATKVNDIIKIEKKDQMKQKKFQKRVNKNIKNCFMNMII